MYRCLWFLFIAALSHPSYLPPLAASRRASSPRQTQTQAGSPHLASTGRSENSNFLFCKKKEMLFFPRISTQNNRSGWKVGAGWFPQNSQIPGWGELWACPGFCPVGIFPLPLPSTSPHVSPGPSPLVLGLGKELQPSLSPGS